MGTRNTIALMLPDGKIKSTYVGMDGFPHHTGGILSASYNDIEKVNTLLSLGDHYAIHNEIENITFYEEGDREPMFFDDINTWLATMKSHWCEFAYLYDPKTNTEEKWIRYDITTGERGMPLKKMTMKEVEDVGWTESRMSDEEWKNSVLLEQEAA